MIVKNLSQQKESYFVAVKFLLRKEDSLLVTHDIFGAWDIPGGRIRQDQFGVPLERVLKEKIAVELGQEIEYELGSIVTTMQIERQEAGLDGQTVRIFAVCYEANYVSGDVSLGEHHDKYEWLDLNSVKLDEYEGGWIGQLGDYVQNWRASK